MMALIPSLFGMRAHLSAEISDNEASDDEASIASEEGAPINEENIAALPKKGRDKAVIPETQGSSMVESDKDEGDEEDDDEEPGEDEYGLAGYIRRWLLTHCPADMWLKRSPAILSMKM
jgi:hypothetical protein